MYSKTKNVAKCIFLHKKKKMLYYLVTFSKTSLKVFEHC